MQWKYKAFDNSMQTHEGLIDGGSVEEIANSYKIHDYQKRNPKQPKISWFKKIKELFKRRRNF